MTACAVHESRGKCFATTFVVGRAIRNSLCSFETCEALCVDARSQNLGLASKPAMEAKGDMTSGLDRLGLQVSG